MSPRMTKRDLARLSAAVDAWIDGGPAPSYDEISRLLAHAVLCDELLDRIEHDLGRAVPDEIAARNHGRPGSGLPW
jgi:hypothetical protein